MKIAISSTGPDLDGPVDQRFGRCRCFVVVDSTSEAFEVLDNQAAMMSGGAGIQAAQMVANSGVAAVITGNLGPNAADTLAAAGVKTYLGASGTVREALQKYKAGQMRESSGPTVASHFGTGGIGGGGPSGRGMGRGAGGGPGRGTGGGSGRGMGMGRGMGQGRGMGRGMGRGRGRGIGAGRGRGMGGGNSFDPKVPPVNEVEELRQQKDQLQKQMKRIEERIRKLEKKN